MPLTRTAALAVAMALLASCQAPMAPSPASVSRSDREFVIGAYQIILFDREEGRMAQVEAGSPEVRQIAAQLVRQADEFDRRLAPIARSLGVEPPSVLDYDRRLRLAHMRLQRGLDFDTTYLDDQVTSHQDAVNAQEMMAGQPGGDGQLVALSRDGLTLIRTNLDRLRQLQRRTMRMR